MSTPASDSTKEASAACTDAPVVLVTAVDGGQNSIDEKGTDPVHKSTRGDVVTMQRMGRTQELVRHFRTLSMISFVALATSAWELAIFTQGFKNGGRPAVMYGLLWCFVGYVPMYLSMAEMASMAPIAGAQYHWVSEFAPARCQKILSYLTGYFAFRILEIDQNVASFLCRFVLTESG